VQAAPQRALVRTRLGKAIRFGFATPEAREPSVAAPLAASRPVMAIYGEKDEFIPFREQIRLVASLGTPNATWGWRAPGAGHLGAYESAPGEYRARVVEFVDASMVEWGKRDPH
jgi:pimeloyl-ACP methyl ester carboxylesterase